MGFTAADRIHIPAGDTHRDLLLNSSQLLFQAMLYAAIRLQRSAMPAAAVAAMVAGLPTGLQAAPNEPIHEQNLYNYGAKGPNNSVLDVANPMELMNRLRNSSSMDNATSPKDAVDAALKQFDKPSGTASKVVPIRP
jgi:hypothetical protein